MKSAWITAACITAACSIAFAQAPAPAPIEPAPPATAAPATPPAPPAAMPPAPGAPPAAVQPGTAPPWAPPGAPVPKADAAAPAPAPEPPKGDVLTLKSGSVLKGVQVLRRLPAQFEVEVSPEVILAIPTKQVEKVDYDDIEPLRNPRGKSASEPAAASNLIPGDKIKPELSAKLAQPFPEPALKFVDEDLLKVLDELGKKLGISIEADEALKALPANQRKVSLEIKPGSNLTTVLQQDIAKIKDLAVEYQFDKIMIKKQATPAPEAASGAEPGVQKPEAPVDVPPAPAASAAPAPAPEQAPPAAPQQ